MRIEEFGIESRIGLYETRRDRGLAKTRVDSLTAGEPLPRRRQGLEAELGPIRRRAGSPGPPFLAAPGPPAPPRAALGASGQKTSKEGGGPIKRLAGLAASLESAAILA
jgi:hypothetical protein